MATAKITEQSDKTKALWVPKDQTKSEDKLGAARIFPKENTIYRKLTEDPPQGKK